MDHDDKHMTVNTETQTRPWHQTLVFMFGNLDGWGLHVKPEQASLTSLKTNCYFSAISLNSLEDIVWETPPILFPKQI